MTQTPPATCARGCRTPDGRREPVVGKTQLCGRCHRQFRGAVTDLADLLPTLHDSQVRGSAPSTAGRVQSSNRIDAGQMWSPTVTGLITQINDWTQYMRRQIDADPRNRVPVWPTDPRVVLYALGRPDAARYLTHQHELAPEFVDEALRLRHRAHAALNSEYVKRYPLAPWYTCLHVVSDVVVGAVVGAADGSDEHACGAPLVATIEPADSGRQSSIRCTVNPTEHRVPPHQWAELGDYVEELRG